MTPGRCLRTGQSRRDNRRRQVTFLPLHQQPPHRAGDTPRGVCLHGSSAHGSMYHSGRPSPVRTPTCMPAKIGYSADVRYRVERLYDGRLQVDAVVVAERVVAALPTLSLGAKGALLRPRHVVGVAQVAVPRLDPAAVGDQHHSNEHHGVLACSWGTHNAIWTTPPCRGRLRDLSSAEPSRSLGSSQKHASGSTGSVPWLS